MAYVLLALCSLIGCVALRFWPESSRSGPIGGAMAAAFGLDFQWAMKLFFTLLALSLIACMAIAAAARRSGADDIRRIKDDGFANPPPRSYLEAPIVVTLIVFFTIVAVLSPVLDRLIADVPQKVINGRLLAIPVSFILAMFSAAGMMYFGFRASPGSAWVAVVLYLVLGWVMPPMADLAWEAMSDPIAVGGIVERTVLFSMSPVGTWLIVIRDVEAPLAAGLAVQTAVAIFCLWLAYRSAHRPRPAHAAA
jgi:MFS family permease